MKIIAIYRAVAVNEYFKENVDDSPFPYING